MEALEELELGGRARRAVPVIAVALVTILFAAVVYLRPPLTAASLQSQPRGSASWTLEAAYQVAYDFVSSTAGWAALAQGESESGHGDYWIFVTSDGARHWRLQATGTTDALPPLVDLHMFDPRHGYVVVGRELALASQDGGVHWERVLLPPKIELGLTFSDPRHGWFSGADGVCRSCLYLGPDNFYATSDGGSRWSMLPAPPGRSLAFRGPFEGWAGTSPKAGGTVFSTDDGGLTWAPHPLPESGTPNKNGRVATYVRLLPGHGVMAMTGQLAFTSPDGGETWRPVVAPPGARFFDMAFQDATHWWAMPSGNLFKTSDAGQTWTHVSMQFDDWQYSVQVVDARHAWARLDAATGIQDPLRGTGLAVTSDGGLHWDYANVPHPTV